MSNIEVNDVARVLLILTHIANIASKVILERLLSSSQKFYVILFILIEFYIIACKHVEHVVTKYTMRNRSANTKLTANNRMHLFQHLSAIPYF